MRERTPIVVGNWKMNLTIREGLRLLTELKSSLSGKQEVEVVVAPSAVSLHPASIALHDVQIGLAAQNMYFEDVGAYTGEVAASMLADVECTYVILGHSERRKLFCEDDQIVRKKLKTAIENDLIPILCVGETAEERQAGKTLDVVRGQLQAALVGSDIHDSSDLLIAYEPVWAIGTGNNATPADAEQVHKEIRKELASIFSEDMAEKVRILYGGSVSPENATELMAQENVDGLLVGNASLDAKSFVDIVFYHEEIN